MKLKEFVKQSLMDITDAVSEVQTESKLHVAPGYVEGEKICEPQMINFEISVVTSKEAGGSINIWSIGEGKASGSNENSNRISFEVPVYFQAPTSKNNRFITDRVSNIY